MKKEAKTSLPINGFAQERWSPRAFDRKPVEKEKLIAMFEAARWSASGGNEQPWRFIVGQNQDESWQKIFSALNEGNQVWNKNVPVLIVAIGFKISSWDGNVSDYFQYDTGQAVANLAIEAMHQGLFVHQMGGFSVEQIRTLFGVNDDHAPLTVIAAGYPGDPETLPENLKKREMLERSRKPLNEIVFESELGNPSSLFD